MWNPFKAEHAFKWGVVITLPYLVFLGWVVFAKWETIHDLQLNGIGDALAGAFGPIAFLWLILGYLQQQQALKIQAKELKNSVTQQRELVTSNNEMIKQEKERFAHSLKPLLLIQDYGYMVDSGNPVILHSLRVINKGFLARQILLWFEGPAYSSFVDKSHIGNDEHWDISYKVTDEAYPVTFHIEYNDGLDQHCIATFNIKLIKIGDYEKQYPIHMVGVEIKSP